MKDVIISLALSALCLAVVPLYAIERPQIIKSVSASVLVPAEEKKAESFRIKFSKSGKIKKISAKEYITGVLCGEVSPDYEKEALKAQAVAAYTFALRRKNAAKERDYDLTDSPSTDQCFISKSDMKKKWADKFEEYYKTMEDCVSEVLYQTVTFENEPALTVYHAISPGVTANAEDVWGSDYPYLRSVDSVGDKLSPGYISTVSFSKEEIKEKLKDLCEIGDGNVFSDTETAESGIVKYVNYNGKKIKGGDIKKALSLRSAAFTAEQTEAGYTFTVLGYGHGVGMSQTGAQYLAKQGSNYREILLHYYKGCEIL